MAKRYFKAVKPLVLPKRGANLAEEIDISTKNFGFFLRKSALPSIPLLCLHLMAKTISRRSTSWSSKENDTPMAK